MYSHSFLSIIPVEGVYEYSRSEKAAEKKNHFLIMFEYFQHVVYYWWIRINWRWWDCLKLSRWYFCWLDWAFSTGSWPENWRSGPSANLC